ncbi:hypothetical protein PMAYCL1PPCAC_25223, partial [Pristionchus mayeri]
MEIEANFLSENVVLMDQSDPTYSTELIDDKGVQKNPCSINPYPIRKQFAFALDSDNRKGFSPIICVMKRKRSEDGSDEEDDENEYWDAPEIFVKTRIYLTKVTGVRTNAHYDFIAPFSSSDATLIVEGKELHVHKEYLSNISTVFRSMFTDNSSGIRNRFELQGVTYQDCIEFLRWVYPPFVKNFEENGMSRMVAFAKKFNVPCIIDQITNFLQNVECFLGLKIILYFGYDVDTQVRFLNKRRCSHSSY